MSITTEILVVALLAVPILATSKVATNETSLDLYKIQPSGYRTKVSYIIGQPGGDWKAIQEQYNAMRAINEADCIVVHKFVKKQITNPPPKKNSISFSYPLGSLWNTYGSYYKFMTDLSKGKNVRSLYLHEDMIEKMKIISEAQRLNYDILWYLDSYMKSLAYYEKYDELSRMMGASFDIQNFIMERMKKYNDIIKYGKIPTSMTGDSFVMLAKQALEHLERTDLNATVETLDKNMKESMDAILRRRTERAVEMVKAESCVFIQAKGDPELDRIIAGMRQAGYAVENIAGDSQDNEI